MAPARRGRRKEAPTSGEGLLAEDYSEIRIVPAEDREWWSRLDREAKLRVAERFRKRWTDDETRMVIAADPDTNDYYELAARMGRTPGSVRLRRSMMIHLLRDEYGYVAKADAHAKDPKAHHKWADAGQVHRVMKELGFFDLTVSDQFAKARHLRQPTGSWRGDNTGAVLKSRRDKADALRARVISALARSTAREESARPPVTRRPQPRHGSHPL